MLPDMSVEGLAAIVRTTPFPIWRVASNETPPRLRVLVTINGRVRSVLLEFGSQPVLVRSRFRTRADEERDAFEQFAYAGAQGLNASQQLRDLAEAHDMTQHVTWYSFLEGVEPPAST